LLFARQKPETADKQLELYIIAARKQAAKTSAPDELPRAFEQPRTSSGILSAKR